MDRIKRIVKKTPIARDIARAAMRRFPLQRASDFNSAEYWEDRYRKGRNSGAGSYNRLAVFKAEVLNRFVAEHSIASVIEFGCGDGSQLRLAEYPKYVGVDVSPTVLDSTGAIFADDQTKSFLHTDEVGPQHRAELSLSLDVVYHLIEDDVFDRYMSQLFDAASRYVIVYASNDDRVYASNDDRAADSVHVRHRKFTDWVGREQPDFQQCGFVPNPYPEDRRDPDNTSFADFYFFERTHEANIAA